MRRRVAALLVAGLLSSTAAPAQGVHESADADSLTALLEDLAWAPGEEASPLETDVAWHLPADWRFEGGTTPAARWSRAGAAGEIWRVRALRRIARDETRTAWHVALDGAPGELALGQLTVQAGCGQLLGAAGRTGPPSASRALDVGGEGWRPYAGRPRRRSFTGMAGVLRRGGWALSAGGGERDRAGRRGGGGRTRFAVLGGGGGGLSTTLAYARDAAGAGGSVAVGAAGDAARGRAELCGWAPPGVAPPPWAPVVTAPLRVRARPPCRATAAAAGPCAPAGGDRACAAGRCSRTPAASAASTTSRPPPTYADWKWCCRAGGRAGPAGAGA